MKQYAKSFYVIQDYSVKSEILVANSLKIKKKRRNNECLTSTKKQH